jgi:hypothetical protein
MINCFRFLILLCHSYHFLVGTGCLSFLIARVGSFLILGACWNQASTGVGFCTTDSVPQQRVGIFDRNNVNNAFKSYSIVHVLYCSGHVHGGNVVREYDDAAGQPVVQAGSGNVQSALEWVKGQVRAGGLAGTFTNPVVMGRSIST